MRPLSRPTLVKPLAPSSSEKQAKIKRIKTRLAEIREYKRILAEEGEKPDADDKILESELIVQLLRLEKGLTAKAMPKPKRKAAKQAANKGRRNRQRP